MKELVVFMLICMGVAVSCSTPAAKEVAKEIEPVNEVTTTSDEQKLITEIEQAHEKALYSSYEAVQFDLNLTFGGKTRFDGTIYMTPDGGLVKMADSNTIKLWNGKKAMVLPDTSNNDDARFGLLTWSYFFGAAYKLNDPGTNHEHLGTKVLGDGAFNANKLTFNQGVGDTPDDWYILYQDKNSGLLAAMAYIVTSGETTVEEAEEDPHVITYEAYTDVSGVPFASQWNFWTWNSEGEMNKLLGSASISNVKLIKSAGDMFKLVPPADDLSDM